MVAIDTVAGIKLNNNPINRWENMDMHIIRKQDEFNLMSIIFEL